MKASSFYLALMCSGGCESWFEKFSPDQYPKDLKKLRKGVNLKICVLLIYTTEIVILLL